MPDPSIKHMQAAFLFKAPLPGFFSTSSDKDKKYSELRLPRFEHYNAKVIYKGILGEGNEGVVFSATIKGETFTVKVRPVEDQFKYFASLAYEARAYARIHNRGQDSVYSCRCYGWMKLSLATLQKAFGLRTCYDLSNYAIVKEFISTLPRPEHLPSIHSGLDVSDKMGIMIEDSSPQNYKGGRLIDLGNAVT
ncbi:hypothetical protein OEA41_007090 [Lepraria neglecta]|uniref:Protein kinase domain-containing protein n=1 Tax=Lepraria neglecta TaxID=209136 RepID=A0AAE0DNN0_9LECA|nr:hypothetical protein OEA41_007090 [Lepraria neglecta]